MHKADEKYFIFTENLGHIEAICWCKTIEEARERAKARKQKYPNEAVNVYIGELLL